MKKTVRALLCAAVIVISGCSSGNGELSEIRFVDAGGHSVLDTPAVTNEADSNEGESTAETGGNAPESSGQDEGGESRGEAVSAPTKTGTTAATSGTPAVTDEPKPQTTPAATTAVTPYPSDTTAAKPQTTAAETPPAATQPEITADIPTEEPPEIPTLSVGTNSYQTLNFSDIKGIWISYIELSEMLTGQSESAFRRNIGAAYDNIAELGLNTVYVHVRSHGDAYYESELFPPSKYASGTLGKAPGFDPLEIMTEEAHARGLSFQAWINPLRCCTTSELSAVKGYKIYELADGKRGAAVNGTYYLNPAYDEVIEYIAQGAAEIAANYDVDGLHIDDYFYPTTDLSFDSAAYAQSGYDTVSAFRLANCDRLVSGIYGAVKSANSSAVFSVSCQGSIENNYNQMYADVKKWCAQPGYLDYVMPQIYYGFSNSAQPYEECASQWNEIARAGGKPLVVGLSVSKVGLEDTWAGAGKTEWITDENILARQIRYALELRSYGGVCLYSYRSVFAPEAGVKAQVDKEMSAVKGLLTEG